LQLIHTVSAWATQRILSHAKSKKSSVVEERKKRKGPSGRAEG
jgi:hypothetical protein